MKQKIQRAIGSPKLLIRIVSGLILSLLLGGILLGLESYYRSSTPSGYFQRWSSEKVMQTVSIEDLRDDPIQSLWYLHIQPPMFDALRALLAQIFRSSDPTFMLGKVDNAIYLIWLLVYSLGVFVVFWWLSELTNIGYAFLSTILFSIHPAFILYATLLDTTLLSTVLILCFYYLLWRVRVNRTVSIALLSISFLLLFFTRSVFQWQWLPLLAISLAMMKLPYRKLIQFLAIVGLVVGLYTIKQNVLFGISSTSSFTGLNLCRSVGCEEIQNFYTAPSISNNEELLSDKPAVLNRVRKFDGSINFNHQYYLQMNQQLLTQYRKQLQELLRSPKNVVNVYLKNLRIYLLPSSQYGEDNVIVDNLSYRSIYDYIFSYPLLVTLVALAILYWFWSEQKKDMLSVLGFCLPIGFIIFLCVFADRGENMRFKFFIEPVIFIFLASQLYKVVNEIKQVIMKSRSSRSNG